MSAGSATRRSGVFAALRSRPSSPRNAETRGVHTTPGATALTRMPCGPELDRRRCAPATSARPWPRRTPRAAAPTVMPDTDATNTIDPPPLAAIARPACCMARNAWRSTMSKCQSQSSSVDLDDVRVARHADDVDDAVDAAELGGRRRRTGARRRARSHGVARPGRCRRPRRRCRRRGRHRCRRTNSRAPDRRERVRRPAGRSPGRRRARRSACPSRRSSPGSRGPGCRRFGRH